LLDTHSVCFLEFLCFCVGKDLLFSPFYYTVGKAFVAGTMLVFGGATAVLLYMANKLQLHSVSHAPGSRLNNIQK
jgi:hypothetical protein